MTEENSTGADPFQEGMTLMPGNPAWQENPYRILDRIREAGRIHHDAMLGRYLVTGFKDVEEVLHDRDLAVDPRRAAPGTFSQMFRGDRDEPEGGARSMLFLDPPEHTRLRSLVQKAFTPRAVDRMAPRIREIADELLDALEGEETWDLMASFAAPYPTTVIAEMLGVDPNDRATFKSWSDAIVAAAFDPFAPEEKQTAALAAGEALSAYIRDALASRRDRPTDDLLAGMLEAEEAGDFLNDDEIVAMVSLLLLAGNLTTTDLIGNGILAFMRNPDEWRKLCTDPSLVENAVEEMLRYDPPVTFSGRITVDEREVAGCPVQAGQSLTVSLGGANYDPEVHADPFRFDITREDAVHLSFGGGRRYCLGSSLARLEARIALTALSSRFPDLHLASEEIERKTVPGFRGLQRLLVSSGARADR